MIDLLREAAELLRDPRGRDPESMDKIATGLLSLVEGAAIVVGLGEREARGVVNSANLLDGVIHDIMGETVEHLRREKPGDFSAVSPLASAAMKIETMMMQEGIER